MKIILHFFQVFKDGGGEGFLKKYPKERKKEGKSGEKRCKKCEKREKSYFTLFMQTKMLYCRETACICISDNHSIIADQLAFVPISLA